MPRPGFFPLFALFPSVRIPFCCLSLTLSLCFGLNTVRFARAQPLELESQDLRPGLVAAYRSLVDPPATTTRIDPKPAFYLGSSSPHRRLPPGPFEVVWTGVILLQDPGPIRFSAFVGGEVTVEVDAATVLEGRGLSDTTRIETKQPLARKLGPYRLMIRYQSLANVPARLQIWWEGPSFAAEPLPAWRLGHLKSQLPREAEQESLREQGRLAAGRFGCAGCHRAALPAISDPPPGPSLADAGRRLSREWLIEWLADPAKVRPGAHMPAVFADDRSGYVERWLIAEHLTSGKKAKRDAAIPGSHRGGRIAFVGMGCVACHIVPDVDRKEQRDLDRWPLVGLADRMTAAELAKFLEDPHGRYPDGRMPRMPLSPAQARDIAAYLLLWSKALPPAAAVVAPAPAESEDVVRRLGAKNRSDAALVLMSQRGCTACHSGLGEIRLANHALQKTNDSSGCLSPKGDAPRFAMDAATRRAITAYLEVAGQEKHPSPFSAGQERLARAGCVRCHQRDSDRPPPLEVAGSTLGGAFAQEVPFQRTPRLTYPHQQFTRTHLLSAVSQGVSGLRAAGYTYRMPSFGADAAALVRALAEGDGELPEALDPPPPAPADPTAGTLAGPLLVGSQGYSCISCHLWNAQQFSTPDPGAVGPDLTRVPGRIRRDWFDRFLEAPLRYHPGTPMPGVFPHGKKALLTTVFDGDPAKQCDALWSYFALGKKAPSPKPPPALPIAAPAVGEEIIAAQIPIRVADGSFVESLCLLSEKHELVIYDLATAAPHSFWTGAQILRTVQGRLRQFLAAGTSTNLAASPALRLVVGGKPMDPTERTLLGYDRLADGVSVRWRLSFAATTVEVQDTLRLPRNATAGRLLRSLRLEKTPDGAQVELRCREPAKGSIAVSALVGEVRHETANEIVTVDLTPDKQHTAAVTLRYDLPPSSDVPAWQGQPFVAPDPPGGSLERPGYRAIVYPRPKTVSREDRIVPGAIAADPRDGRVFVASLKTGELFALHDPTDDGKQARFENYTRGLFQDALSMLAADEGLYVLHRRNLTRIVDTDGDGRADRFDRVAALPHGVADTYDYAYGLARDRSGHFVLSYAPYANPQLPGSGGAIRLRPGLPPEEVAYGFRNATGWCAGPGGKVFYTDNQGEWVATSKFAYLAPGRYHGFPNPQQKQHTKRPAAKPTVWVPYGWARSINGVTYDNTGGKFGPFAGQFFLAELMFGGAIVRANVEKVNGEYQGACFPFWGAGLLGPLCLTFDPKGRLFVGGITEPGWMAQPDRGAVFRIDFTGQTPFEMQSIHVRPRGFRIVFTTPLDRKTAEQAASYHLEHYRYEYTGAYGSPELDRTTVALQRVDVSADGRTVDLTTAPLVKDRVYLITASGVRSVRGEQLVHSTGAYTLNEIPTGGRSSKE
jgi:hypothetical protein